MFFIRRWYKKGNLGGIIKKNDLRSIDDVVEFLFKRDENGKPLLDIIKSRVTKKQSAIQRLNMIWFFFVFWIFIAPVSYVMTGYTGVDQRSWLGKLMLKIIGPYYIKGKVYNYKSGYTQYMTKKEFVEMIDKLNFQSFEQFKDRYTESSYNQNTDFIIEDPKSIYVSKRTKMNRFNEFWLYPIFFIGLLFVGPYRWIRYNDFDYDRKNKFVKMFLGYVDEKVNSKEM